MNKVISLLAILTVALAVFTIFSYQNPPSYPEDTQHNQQETVAAKQSRLNQDLPDYLFEKELEEFFPATWRFYKRLDMIQRDQIYSFYLYNPDIVKIRRKIFELASNDE